MENNTPMFFFAAIGFLVAGLREYSYNVSIAIGLLILAFVCLLVGVMRMRKDSANK